MKTLIITESTYNWVKKNSQKYEAFDMIESLIDEDYPSSWDKDEFKSLTSFKKRIAYCNEHLQRISSGSSRIAYKIDNQKVLKLAKNKKGLAQNEVEVGASHDNYFSEIFAKVFDYDAHDLWLEMEIARKVTEQNFEKITGIGFDIYSALLKDSYHQYKGHSVSSYSSDYEEEELDEVWEHELFQGVEEYMRSYDVPAGDLARTSSYGIVNRSYGDDIVLIDYGLTHEVYDSYYS